MELGVFRHPRLDKEAGRVGVAASQSITISQTWAAMVDDSS
jgi:hypothetical protein